VLIRGAAGGLGLFAIQIARLRGAITIGVTSNEEKAEVAKSFGANHIIIRGRDTAETAAKNAKNFLNEVKTISERYDQKGVDVVFDHIGGESIMESIRALRHGGNVVTCGATSGYQTHVELANLFIQNKAILGSTLGTKAELVEALRCVLRGQVKPYVWKTMHLKDCGEAQELLRTGQAIGKVVLTR
jgi:NADPH:quinone reductase-like Zn-dependent oxidoreductase